jgi:hypothetical protein
MSHSKRLRIAIVAITSMCLITSPVLAIELTKTASQKSGTQKTIVRDVELSPSGSLTGQLVNPNGTGVENTVVRLVKQDGIAAVCSTDENGAFEMKGVQGGIYIADAKGAQTYIRAWAPGTAPPKASTGLLLISKGQTVRGGVGKNVNFGGITDGVFRWDEFGGMVSIPLILGAAIGFQHIEQEARVDGS